VIWSLVVLALVVSLAFSVGAAIEDWQNPFEFFPAQPPADVPPQTPARRAGLPFLGEQMSEFIGPSGI
jgi:hypothetical protein